MKSSGKQPKKKTHGIQEKSNSDDNGEIMEFRRQCDNILKVLKEIVNPEF